MNNVGVKRTFNKVYISSICLLAMSVFLVGCSSDKSTETKKDKLDFGTKVTKKNKNIVGSISELAKINSEEGAKSFSFNIASSFVSSDVKEGSGLQNYISTSGKPNILNSLIARNNSTTLPSVSFTPIAVTVDNYTNQKTSIAVLGLSFTSSSLGVSSSYKEIRFDLVYEDNWKVSTYILSEVDGVTGNGEILDSSFSELLNSYVVPSDEFVPSDRKIVDESKIDNKSKTTEYISPGE